MRPLLIQATRAAALPLFLFFRFCKIFLVVLMSVLPPRHIEDPPARNPIVQVEKSQK